MKATENYQMFYWNQNFNQGLIKHTGCSGLYGPNGILPVHGKLDPSPALNKNQIYSPSKLWELFKTKPTLLWYSGMFSSRAFSCLLLCKSILFYLGKDNVIHTSA